MPQRRSPLRENAFRIATVGVSFVIGVVVAIVLLSTGSHRAALSPKVIALSIGVGLLAAALGLAIGLLIGRRIVGDRIEVATRKPGTKKWRHGRLTVTPGHLSFQPYRWQMRIPGGPPIEMDVEHLGEDTGRRPSLKQIWSVNPQLHIVDVSTTDGDWEVAALPSRFTELRERLDGREPSRP